MNLRLKLWCLLVCSLVFSGCAWFTTQPHSEVPPAEQPLIAVLPKSQAGIQKVGLRFKLHDYHSFPY